MKKENIKYLRNYLANLSCASGPVGFSMERWYGSNHGLTLKGVSPPECGTVACIGGWTDILFTKTGRIRAKPLFDDDGENGCSYEQTGEKLGLDSLQSDQLFFMTDSRKTLSGQTLKDAVRVLTGLLETGKVRW